MDIKPVRTEADYEVALKEIEGLWGAEPDPIEAIKYYMDSRGLDR